MELVKAFTFTSAAAFGSLGMFSADVAITAFGA